MIVWQPEAASRHKVVKKNIDVILTLVIDD